MVTTPGQNIAIIPRSSPNLYTHGDWPGVGIAGAANLSGGVVKGNVLKESAFSKSVERCMK